MEEELLAFSLNCGIFFSGASIFKEDLIFGTSKPTVGALTLTGIDGGSIFPKPTAGALTFKGIDEA